MLKSRYKIKEKIKMRNPLSKFRGAKITGATFFNNANQFHELLQAIEYLNPTASEQEVFYMGTTTLLAISDPTRLSKAVQVATDEAVKKAKEVSDLNDMFNAPSTTTNNN